MSHPFLLALCIPFFSVVSQWMWFAIGSTAIVYFWGPCEHVSMSLLTVLFFCHFQWKMLRCIFESCHMVNSLGASYGVIYVCTVYFHYFATFWCSFLLWDLMGMWFWRIYFDCANFHFWHFLFFYFWMQLLNIYLVGF